MFPKFVVTVYTNPSSLRVAFLNTRSIPLVSANPLSSLLIIIRATRIHHSFHSMNVLSRQSCRFGFIKETRGSPYLVVIPMLKTFPWFPITHGKSRNFLQWLTDNAHMSSPTSAHSLSFRNPKAVSCLCVFAQAKN